MDIDKTSFIRSITTDLTARRFRVSPPGSLQPATGWDSDLDVMVGDGEWIALFVVTDVADLADTAWLQSRRYNPGRPSRPFALLSMVPTKITEVNEGKVFDFSDYGRALELLVSWLAASGGEAARGSPAAEQHGEPRPGEAQPYAPIEELERFEMSQQAEMIVRFARVLTPFYIGGAEVLFSELLVFAAAESGRVNPDRSAGVLWRAVAGADYESALRQRFPQWVPKLAHPADTSVRQVSRNTLAVLTGARHIARRTTGVNRISARHLLAALYVVRPTAARPTPAADYAQTLGFPNVRDPVLAVLSTIVEEDRQEEWSAIVSGTWTVDELAASGPLGAAPVGDAAAATTDRTLDVRTASLSDAVATRDRLGFEPYVNAVAAFITNSETKGPLTLAVEGEWGSGKSSFMRQVQKAIRFGPGGEEPAQAGGMKRLLAALNPRHDPGPLTVWFNPWRHDREDALWAAFALEFLRDISSQLSPARRLSGHLKLLCTRFSWRDGGWEFARMVLLAMLALTIVGVVLTMVLYNPKFVKLFTTDLKSGRGLVGTLLKLGGAAGALALGVSVGKEVKSFMGNPFRVGLKQYVKSPDYQARISFVEQFHRDFGKMIGAYAGGEKVYVFIDDLDRCQVPRAADLMQALNLMIATEQPLVFIIGMDREKIAASLAVKFKDVIPYIGGPESLSERPWAHADATAGLEFGSEFIEKFVQVSIRVPQPRESDITRLLEDLSPTVRTGSAQEPAALALAPGAGVVPRVPQPAAPANAESPVAPNGSVSTPTPAAPAAPVMETRRAMRRDVSVDSPRLHDIVRLVAPALDYNPRRVKQFINACRLHAYIAIETGLIAGEDGIPASALTFENLGKFVALALRWPLLVTHLEKEPALLQRLEAIALGRVASAATIDVFWASRPRLMELLRAGSSSARGEATTHSPRTYAFEGVDIVQLLRVTTGAPPATSPIPVAEALQPEASPPLLTAAE
ncbi:MAG TPA: P-loop NTPase fold protein [Longimicrobiaceae bacterium]|nr:P-loop NTPase fold protein [Longimicrobiaceae bacterium]